MALSAREAFADSGSVVLHQVRVGQHPDKTRIVVDLGAFTDFSYAIDPGEGFHISFPDITARAKSYPSGGVIASTSFDTIGTGGYLLIKTAAPVEFAEVFMLSPDSYGGHRIVLDVRKTQNWELAKPLAVEQQSSSQQSNSQQAALPAYPTGIPQTVWQVLGMAPQTAVVATTNRQTGAVQKVAATPSVPPVMPVQSSIDPLTWKAMAQAQKSSDTEASTWWQFW